MDRTRPADVKALLRRAIPNDPTKQTSITHISQIHALDVLDTAWQLLGNPALHPIHAGLSPFEHSALLRKLCLKLATTHNILPSSFYVVGVVLTDSEPVDSGGFADIYHGLYGDRRVVLKRPRSNEGNRATLTAEFCRESLLWSKLDHLHVLSFIGIAQDAFPTSICMVLPEMEHGNIRHRIVSKQPAKQLTAEEFESRVIRWIYEAALGLAYLHGQGVVHGDLHGGNLLIDSDDHVKLTDFGYSLIASATPHAYGSKHGGAAQNFIAPELYEPERYGLTSHRPTAASDIYAFGCMCIELYTNKVPFANLGKRSFKIIQTVLKGGRPDRPSTPSGALMTEHMWEVVQATWKDRPQDRPTAENVVRMMEKFATM